VVSFKQDFGYSFAFCHSCSLDGLIDGVNIHAAMGES